MRLGWSVVASVGAIALSGAIGCRQALGIDEEAPPTSEAPDAGEQTSPIGTTPRQTRSYCASLEKAPDFCDDFDGDAPVITAWDNAHASPDPFVTGGGSLKADEERFQSGPRAVTIETPMLLAPSTASVALVKSFSTAPKELVLDVGVRIDTEDFREAGQIVQLVSVTFPVGGIAIGRGESGLSIGSFDGKKSTSVRSTIPMPVGAWHRLSLLLFDSEVTLHVDGVLAAKLERGTATTGKGVTYLGVGVLSATGNIGPFRATFDNVSFTTDAKLR